ncbi:MAG TPA: TonB-dependent receptor [Puia sp.]|nr:TonB-dependent receptor [Puia sp.]
MKTVYLFLMAVLLFCSSDSLAQTILKGSVKNSSSKERLSGAFVSCLNNKGFLVNTTTGNDGEFKFKNLAPGDYDLKVEFVGYATYTTHLTLAENKTTEVGISLLEKAAELSDVQVFGKVSQEDEAGARLKEKRSNNIVNVISARAMERSPDINAANVLQRMSGLTIQRNGGGDEAYPIIRGLDPRYNNTLINGIKITSPDDKSRYVPLNIVPSDLLGSIEVHKSLLPEMEGDAIGGSVNMVMKDAPEKEVFKVLGSLGYNKIFIDRKFVNFSRKDIQQKSVIEKYGSSYTAQPDDFSRSNLDFKETRPMPNTVAGFVYGRRFLHRKLGLLVAENFQEQYYGSNSIFNKAAPDVHAGGAPTISDYANRSFSTRQLNEGLTMHLDYALNDRNKITLTSITLYSALSQARIITDTSILGGNGGRTVAGTGPVSTDYTSITSRQFLQNLKLEGKHILSKHFLVDWAGVFSYAAKRTPDMADLSVNKKIDTVHTTNDIHGPYTFVTTPDYFDDITRIWQHNEDKDFDGMANLAYRTKMGEAGSLELKTGGLYRHKVRYNIQDEYDLKPTTSSSGIKQEFTNINAAQWTVYNSSGTYDYDVNKYRLYEDVTAGYGEAKISLASFDIFGGVRVEKTKQGYTLNTFYPTGINGVNKDYTDVLPSIDLKYKLNPLTNIRLSYYKAIARPNYYDLVPATRLSTTSATATKGNPYLNHTVSDNYDIRYEWYPREDEQLFAGIFYKKLANPIENIYVDGITYQPQNLGDATDYGAELAFTRYFGNIGITGNYTYLHSAISSPKSFYNLTTGYINTDTLQKRTLQGQTDHTLNLSLLYRNKKRDLFAELAFQYTGRSIGLVYLIYGYDYYQQPQSNLAFSAEKELKNRHFTLFTKANNLLNTPSKNQINGLLMQRDITKFNFSLGIRYEK